MPPIRPMFAMFDPIALPIARLVAPLKAALIATRISGVDVAKPTTVRPTSIGETPRLLAVALAPMTMRSAPQMSRASPTRIAAEYISMGDDYNDCLELSWTA